jgi:hypothetical protein
MGRAHQHEPFFRYHPANDFRGRIVKISKAKASFSAPYHVAYLKAVRRPQLEARFPVSSRETPQLFHDSRASEVPTIASETAP